ncbi:arylsulfatase [Nocardioides sp. BE266]|uniref:sulfatase-like hydrolase/transferase n=1 Tax=Nocardioides sp. BE266 TaxID=2817725 RepID=UPI002867128C|nr:sulfatase-like hydrolase/transferase [Nocardioides sp. BE266]MDR7251345.1 arylsulfatase [Nocardioides sp. BE266]
MNADNPRTDPDRSRLPLDVDTTARPIRPVEAPPRSPNVVVVLVDDMGFGASSPYGGPCEMPTAQRLADEGLRYSRFHVTSLCSPTRQALMTGRNHHSVGMGVTSEMSTPEPGYHGYRPASAATIAQILSGNGYCTAAIGKWHQTPPVEVSPSGPFPRWPMGEGFDFFYGFMGAEMNHWYPQLYQGRYAVEPDKLPEDGYHLSEDLVEKAISWIENQQAITPDRPFFTYVAFGATHAPFHVAPEWRDKYAGRFDAGWDAQREETLARQKELGIVPESTDLAPWATGVPRWEELDETEKRVAARFMETYAGFAEHTDAQVGRLVEALEDMGVLDDTLIIYMLGDNGASGEGGPRGTFREHLVGHGIQDETADMAARLDTLGDPTTYAIYPVGWALAMNTPYPWTKQLAHLGGTRDGMIVRWGNGIEARGEIRHQWHHVIDVLPTILEAAGVPAPAVYGGVDQQPIEGTSLAYSFDDADAPERRSTQYFEMIGNRGIFHEGWTAVTQHSIPWEMVGDDKPPFDEDVWELYDHTSGDWSQAHDVASKHPDKLRELQELFMQEAARYHVLPLDDRVTERENPDVAGRLDLHLGRSSLSFGPRVGRLTEEAAPNVKNRSHVITADLEVVTGASGVVAAQGGRFGGWSLYLVNGVPHYAYNFVGRDLTVVRGGKPMLPGRHDLVVRFDYDGGPVGSGADVRLEVDGVAVGSGRIPTTTAYYFSFDETFNVGVDRGTPVVDDYLPVRNAFEGLIHRVRFDLDEVADPGTDEGREQAVMVHQ